MAGPTEPRWREIFASLPGSGKLLLLSAVFCIFAPVALLYELSSSHPRPWGEIVVWCTYNGLVAVGWVYAVSARLWVLWFVIPLSFLLPYSFGRAFWGRGDVVSVRGAEALAALLTLIVGYVLYMAFIGREGMRSLRHRTEIELARRIHDTLVPDLDLREGPFWIYGAARPATEVGGDLLDCVRTRDRTAVFLADISGHGVAAGVRMAMLKGGLRTRLQASGTLSEVVTDLNAIHLDLLPPGMFTTFAAVELRDGDPVSFASAGHHPLLHWRASTATVERRDIGQPPLGVLPGLSFQSISFAVLSGDLLVMLTDGLTEVFDSRGEEFGLERFEQLVTEHARLPLPELFQRLVGAVQSYGGQTDDQTLVLIRRA